MERLEMFIGKSKGNGLDGLLDYGMNILGT
jgi:hypothetical protein